MERMIGATRWDSLGEISPAPAGAASESIINRSAEIGCRYLLEQCVADPVGLDDVGIERVGSSIGTSQ